MCLGVPGKVLAIDGLEATVDFFGVKKQLRLDIVDEPVVVGDYVLNHVGFAIRRIPPEEALETLVLFEEVIKASVPGDLMAEDVFGEMAAAPATGEKAAGPSCLAYPAFKKDEKSEQAAPPGAGPQRVKKEEV
jgi:hydrogenase expression/formation protein HypC